MARHHPIAPQPAVLICVVWLIVACPLARDADSAGLGDDTRVVAAVVLPEGLVEDEELEALLELPVPGPWNDDRIALTRENLELSGRFETVSVSTEPSPGGVRLVFLVTPRPWAAHIVFAGRSQVSADDLLQASRLRPYAAIPGGAVVAAADHIAQHYEQQGFPRPRVEVATRPVGSDGATDITFTIHESPLPRSVGVYLDETGWAPWHQRLRLHASLLRAKIGMRSKGSNLVRMERLAEREERRLRRLGYADATVVASGQTVPSGEVVHLEVAYGKRTTVTGKDLGRRILNETTRSWRERRRPLTPRVVDRFVSSAEAALQEAGYLDAKVVPHLEESGSTTVLTLEAQRGPRACVAAIEFRGNQSVPAEELRSSLEITPPRWFGLVCSRPGPEALAAGERAVRDHYASRGFPDAAVSVSLEPGHGTKQKVIFTVDEGPCLSVGSIRFHGAEHLHPELLLRLLAVERGAPLSRPVIESGVTAIGRAYQEAGFADTAVRVEEGRPDGHGRVDLSITIQEGTATTLGPTIVQNAFKTRPSLIQKLHKQKRGDPFDPEQLARLQQALNRLSIFDGVTIAEGERSNAPEGETAALVRVRDTATAYYEIGVDYNSDRGLELLGAIGDRSLFRRGLAASLSGLLGGERQGLSLNLTQPLLFGVPLTTFLRATSSNDRTNPSFAERRLAGELGAEKEITTRLRVSLAFRLERETPYQVEPDVANALPAAEKRIGSLNPALTWEDRDDPFNATRGSFVAVRWKSSRRGLGAAAEFDRYELDARAYRSLSEAIVLAAALRFGDAKPRGGETLPVTERFFIGGAGSHRGFREKELGPKGRDGSPLGGESFVLVNLELRLPLLGALDAGVFVDAGNVFLTGWPRSDLRWAAGAGLRVRTPVGPIRLDLGFNLDPRDGEARSLLHIALGHAF